VNIVTAPGRRPQRVGEQIREELSALLVSGLRDPRIGFTTITEVSVSPDLRQARIFLSVMGSTEEQQQSIEAFGAARNFIRRELAHRLKLRRIPELLFELDRTAEYADHINHLLRQADIPAEETEGAPDQEKGEKKGSE
jgi:ribosome-binding factor A